ARAANPARAAWLVPAFVAIAARYACVADDPSAALDVSMDVLNALNDTAEEGLALGEPVQHDLRSADVLHRPASRDGRRQVEFEPVTANYLGRSIRTMLEFCRERSKTMYFPSGVMSNVRKAP